MVYSIKAFSEVIPKAVISPLSMDSSQSSTTLCNAVCVECCFQNADWSADIKL